MFLRHQLFLRGGALAAYLRLGLALGKPGLVESDFFRISNSTRLEQYRYRPTRPEIVGFE